VRNLPAYITAACAAVLTVFMIGDRLGTWGGRTGSTPPPPVTDAGEWKKLLTPASVVADSNSVVSMVIFTDYQCPWCARLEQSIAELRAEYGYRLAVHYRHRPLVSIHPQAVTAATIAECAREQGSFPAMHALLFEKQDSLATLATLELGRRAEVPDLESFDECVRVERPKSRLEIDQRDAEENDVGGTPVGFVNGKRFRGALTASALDSLIGRKGRWRR
jgi:protein-disulfide isomerase